MSSNVANTMPYLRSTRQFPADPTLLQVELTRAWTETANCLNQREIAFYVTSPFITGQQWYADVDADEQGNIPTRLGFRQVYQISSFSTFSHNIANVTLFTQIAGGFTDGSSNFYPLPYVSSTAAGQIGIRCTSTQVIFSVGGTAPSIASGFVLLEYLLN